MLEKEKQRLRASNLRSMRMELQKVRKQMAKEFFEKRTMIIEKLKELKKENKSIEEIYKYTNDIILEEEDEEDEEEQTAKKLSAVSNLNKSVDYNTEPQGRDSLEVQAPSGVRSSMANPTKGHYEQLITIDPPEKTEKLLPDLVIKKRPSLLEVEVLSAKSKVKQQPSPYIPQPKPAPVKPVT